MPRKTIMDMCAFGRSLRFASAAVLMGCGSSGSGYESYGAVRSAFDRSSVIDSRTQSEDDRALAGPVLDRAGFVRAVLDRNRSMESARQGWRAAIARVHQSGVLDDPMVTVDMAPLSIGAAKTRFSWDAIVSQKLPWPGKLSLDEAVAAAEADAAKSDFESARRELALAAALLFDRYFVTARSIEINAHHVDLMRSMRAAAAAQYETGRGSAQDPLQAEFELAHMEHDTVILASQRDVAVAQMNELLHRAPELPLPPPPNELPEPAARDATDMARLEREAVEGRPDIAAARERARAEQARGDRARREAFPDVTVSTAYSAFWDAPEQRWTVGLNFNLPVQIGRRAGAVDEANAMRAQFDADASRMSDAARTQVVVAVKELEESEHVLGLYEQRLVPIARDEVDAARAAFTASQTPFVVVVDAEKNLRSVELDREIALADYDRRRAELDRALGRVPGLDAKEVTP
jgi:cobalt-zinc-cadmium efflux system outer membrane protein